MESLLVAGAESMVGANFAAQCADLFDVTACHFGEARPIAGCQSVGCRPDDPRAVSLLIQEITPQRLVYCGAGARSAWSDAVPRTERDVSRAEVWLQAAQAANVAVTLISSDAVFTGPWMFHPENSQSLCPSAEAAQLRAVEQRCQEIIPESLVLRTHTFGWSSPWLETMLSELEAGQPCRMDCICHASPILVNDFIDITLRSWQAGLAGVYHVAGAERTNPAAFAQRVAAEFGYRIPKIQAVASLTDRSSGFGSSETSLQTRKIRRALGVAVPLLGEGLRKLRQLSLNGYRDRVSVAAPTMIPARVA